MSEKKLFCTAGSSYMMFYPNGDVYRCMRDYSTREKILFNLKETNFQIIHSKKTQLCNQIICNSICDSDWSTKFLYEGDDIQKKIPAQEWGGISYNNSWKNQEIDNDVDFITIIFTPTLPCNYTCNYCACAAGVNKIKEAFASTSPEMTKDEWLKVFKNVLLNYKKIHIQTNGGEPLLSEATIPVIKYTADRCSINLVSNISVKIPELINAKIKPYDENLEIGLQVTASLHPTSKNWVFEPFLGKLLLLKKNGYLRGVNFVAWPGQIYLFDYFKEILSRYEIKIWLQPWVGPDNFGYKQYNEKEIEYLEKNVDDDRSIEKQYNFSDYVSIPNKHSTCTLIKKEEMESRINYLLEFHNTGKTTWSKYDNIKLGTRIFNSSENRSHSSYELRKEINEIKPDEKIKVSFEIEKNILKKYKDDGFIVFDVVWEGKFWFQELGSKVFEEKII